MELIPYSFHSKLEAEEERTKRKKKEGEMPSIRVRDILRRIRLMVACCGSQLIVENSQIDGKPSIDDGDNDNEVDNDVDENNDD